MVMIVEGVTVEFPGDLLDVAVGCVEMLDRLARNGVGQGQHDDGPAVLELPVQTREGVRDEVVARRFV